MNPLKKLQTKTGNVSRKMWAEKPLSRVLISILLYVQADREKKSFSSCLFLPDILAGH